VGAAASFDGADALRGKRAVAGEEFGVFAGEDVIGDSGDGVGVSEGEAECEHEGGFAGAYGAVVIDVR